MYLKHIIMEYHFLSTKRNNMVRELDKIVPEFEKQDTMKAIMGGKIPRTNMKIMEKFWTQACRRDNTNYIAVQSELDRD